MSTPLPRPAACTCGAIDLQSCICGTTAGDWAAAARTQEAPQTPLVDGDGYYQGTGPADRIRAYLEALSRSQGLSTEQIHSYGTKGIVYELRASDIQAVLAQLDAECANCGEVPGNHFCPTPEGAPANWFADTYTPKES